MARLHVGLVLASLAGLASGGTDQIINPVMPLSVNTWVMNEYCLPGSWKDYSLNVTEHMSHDNILFEVVDVNQEIEGHRQDALSLHLFENNIPPNRQSGRKTITATFSVYELSLTSWDVKEGLYYLSIKCGSQRTTYNMNAREIKGYYDGESDSIEGQLCKGTWMYHGVDVTAEAVHDTPHMRIHVKSTDYVYGLVTEDDTPPLFLVNPYYLLHSGENHITICNADAGHRYYLGLLGHRTCVAYETEVEFFAGDCELEHSDDISDRHGLVELEVDHLYLQSGKQHAVYDFYFHVDADKTNNNLVFEVQDMSAELRTGALTIKLYSGKIPVDRQSEYYADFASGGLYSLAVNVLDLVEGDYYISVTVNEVDTDFRVLARCILGEMHIGQKVHGVVCPGEMIYHYYDNTYGIAADIAAGYDDDEEDTGHRRRRLTATEADSDAHAGEEHDSDASSENIRFKLLLHSGRVEYSVAQLVPLLKMVPPNRNADYQIHSLPGYEYINIDICDAQRGMQYLVIKGLETCAEYEVTLVEVASEECQNLEHQCLEDCTVLCTELGIDHYEYQMCEAHEWKDFKFQVTEEHLLHALNVEVSTGFGTANSRDFEAIGLYMWHGRLPTDRSIGDLMALYSVEQSFVISVSAHDLQAGWYYYGVKCGPVATHFRILATIEQALMHDGDAARQTVCPGNWAYYMVQAGPQDHSSDEDDAGGHRRLMATSSPSTSSYNSTGKIEEVVIETYGHARFKLMVHSGDLYYMERHKSAPIMLAPPFGHIDYLEALASHTVLEAGTHFIGLYGGSACANFEMSMELVDGAEECHEISHDVALEEAKFKERLVALRPHHSQVGSCKPYAFTDFWLECSETQAGSNLVVQVVDTLQNVDTEALSVHMFYGRIPEDRKTMRFDDRGEDHVYSVAMNAWELVAGSYFISVRCGPQPVQFTIVTELFTGEMPRSGDRTAGLVCSGEMVFHHVVLQDLGIGHDGGNIELQLKVYNGDIRYKLQHHHPALKIYPPFATAHADELDGGYEKIEQCHADYGDWYITMTALQGCSAYDLQYFLHDPDHPCSTSAHEPPQVATKQDLKAGHFFYDMCYANAYSDFHIGIDMDEPCNLLIEVEDLSPSLVTGSLSLWLYNGSIPEDRWSERRSLYSSNKIWSISLSSNELTSGDFFLSVKCAAENVRFRAIYHEIPAMMESDVWVESQVCPGDWVHHFYDISSYQASGELIHASMEFEVSLHIGSLFYKLQAMDPATELTPPFRNAIVTDDVVHFTTSFCNVEYFPLVHKYYLSIRGGSQCAYYSIRPRLVTGECVNEFDHDSALDSLDSVTRLQLGKLIGGTCQADSFLDYTFVISEDEARNNLLFQVEDLSVNDNPNSLIIHLYTVLEGRTSIPVERNPDYEVTTAKSKLYTVALDYFQLQAGTYFASVRCTNMETKFRVSVSLIESVLYNNQLSTGGVAPAEWAFHYYYHTDTSKKHVRFHFRKYYGDIYMILMRKDKPPGFAIQSKNRFMGKIDEYLYVDACDVDAKTYVGLHGGALYSQYSIYMEAYNDGDISTQTGSALPDAEILTCHEYVATKEGYTKNAAAARLPSLLAGAAYAVALYLIVCG